MPKLPPIIANVKKMSSRMDRSLRRRITKPMRTIISNPRLIFWFASSNDVTGYLLSIIKDKRRPDIVPIIRGIVISWRVSSPIINSPNIEIRIAETVVTTGIRMISTR